MNWIETSVGIGIKRIELEWVGLILNDSQQTKFKTFSGLVQNDSETDFGIAWIRSDWIPFWNFHQVKFKK